VPTYTITAAAGLHVAGRRLGAGQKTIDLSEAEAAYELQVGSIEPVQPTPTAPVAPVSGPVAPDAEAAAPETSRRKGG